MAKWSCIELNSAIVCGCLITLRPLLARWMSRFGIFQSWLPSPEQQKENSPVIHASHTIGSRRQRPIGVHQEGIDIYSTSLTGTSVTCVTQTDCRMSGEKPRKDLEAQAEVHISRHSE